MMRKRIKQLNELPAEDRLLLFHAILLLPLIAIALGLFGFGRTRSLLAALTPGQTDTDNSATEQLKIAQRVTKIVTIAANRAPYRANCLGKSLAVWWLLARRGIIATLEIGTRKNNDGLDAHAWVSLDNIPLEQDTARYESFDSLTPGH